MTVPKLWVVAGDAHYPELHAPTFDAMRAFLTDNKVEGFVFGGDQFDNACISHHTKGKPLLRERKAYVNDQLGFLKHVLNPLEAVLPKSAERVWIHGNHDHWEDQLIEAHPEYDGMQRRFTLGLEERGWKFIDCGKHFTKGKLTIIHGDQLASSGYIAANHSRKALEIYGQNVLYHHMHAPQSSTKVMPFDVDARYMAWCAPILGKCNPHYLRNRATAWLNGFTILEFWGNRGHFNLYPVIVSKGSFAYGGKLYSA